MTPSTSRFACTACSAAFPLLTFWRFLTSSPGSRQVFIGGFAAGLYGMRSGSAASNVITFGSMIAAWRPLSIRAKRSAAERLTNMPP
jgi:hypothetical protein